MKSVGVIVECNPFHNGHMYYIQEARTRARAEVVVAAMSGNFVQRGMPALVDKWKRAEVALKNGVDLVVELPVEVSVQSADYFARGSVALLQRLGVENLAFGTDVKSESPVDYAAFGKVAFERKKEMDAYFQMLKEKNQSYPARMTEVYRHFFPEILLDFSSPNHVLGLAYARENARYENPMKLIALPRKAGEFAFQGEVKKIASATEIREKIFAGKREAIQEAVPELMNAFLENPVSWANYFLLLNYRVRSSSVEELARIYQMNEGVEYRLHAAIREVSCFSELVERLKTKRYTQVRIQRLLLYVLLGMKKDMERKEEFPFRILGFTKVGREFLNLKKKSLELISRVGHQTSGFTQTLMADAIYQLGAQTILEQNYGRIPLFVE